MSWRPVGWQVPSWQTLAKMGSGGIIKNWEGIYEAGADAILEALKKTAARVENEQFVRDGWLVFIEDDK